ncbi:MAG TPA: CHASE3 domain-containing protein [Lacunisphaera sp.]|nr:CHASE3 domain-containing protein [Lacunisphaera sp.]
MQSTHRSKDPLPPGGAMGESKGLSLPPQQFDAGGHGSGGPWRFPKGYGPRTIAFVVALLLLLGTAAAAALNIQALVENTRWVGHTHEVLSQLTAVLSSVQDVETGTRGYVLTGKAEFLDRVPAAQAAIAQRLEGLRRSTADNPEQQQRLTRLAAAVDRKTSASLRSIELRRSGDAAGAQTLVAGGEGKRAMDDVRDVVDEAKRAEQRLLQKRQDDLGVATFRTLLAVGSGVAVAIALLVVIFFLLHQEIARRSDAEVALRRSEESLEITLQSIGDGVLATDTRGRITRLNRVAEELTGWPLADARGRPVAEVFRIVHGETRAPAVIPVDQVLATGQTLGLANHTTLIARDNTERAIADSAAPIRDADGRILGVVLAFRDVTVERMAQGALQASEERYRTLFSSIDEGFCIVELIFDAQGSPVDYRFLEVNPAFARQTGLKDAVGRRMRELAPDLEAEWFSTLGGVAVTGTPVRLQGRAEPLKRAFDVYAFRIGAPEARRVAVIFSDVTERVRAQQELHRLNAELQESAAELRSLFESLPGLYLILTPRDYRIVAASDAYLQATMTARGAIVGRGLFEVFPDNPDDPTADGVRNLRASLERVAEHGAPDTMAIQKYDVRRPDGVFEERYWSPINSPLQGKDGKLRYIIHRVEDVTEFVRRRKAPADGNDLRSRVEQMEAEVFHSAQKVQAANRQLEAANRELESFSYSVSHDLRAPLRHIQGYVEMLTAEARPNLSAKAQRYLQTIAAAAHEMGELIDDLLAFSRMGRAEMRESQVDLAALVAETRQSLEPAINGRQVNWKVGPLPPVRGDAAMLRLALVNLLGNAIKYTRRRPRAEIEIGVAGEEAGQPVFFIRDNGAGFDMKYADKLFGVFQRLHRADEFEGTGIGLANVQRIIARHGGRIWAEARVDAGATFYFTLAPASAGQSTNQTP